MEYGDFIDLLKRYDIKILVDIRAHPNSSQTLWASQKNLSRKLGSAYSWLSELGGPTTRLHSTQRPQGRREEPEKQHPKAWVSQELFNFDVWMGTNPAFLEGLRKLQKLRDHWHNVVIYCSEILFWKCHRSMVSDAWVAMGGQVNHIMSKSKVIAHPLGDRLERYTEKTRTLWPKMPTL